jgi:phage terminase Nu1 subunit (DNA packaging protein)
MPKRSKANKKPASQPETLKGWKEIAEFLGEPISVVKRWRSEGMPVVEQGRFVTSSAEQLSAWLGRESGKPVHVVTPEMDLASELKRGIAFVRRSAKDQNLKDKHRRTGRRS